MTVSSIVPVNTYAGNSAVKKFDFDFLIENENELIVQHISEDNVITTLMLGVDYSINEIGNQNGSYIIFPLENSSYNILKENERITLMLTLTIKQESEFKNSSYFNLNILEWTFDYIVRILQILSRKIERCVKVGEGLSSSPDELMDELNESKRIALNAAESALESKNISEENKNKCIDYLEEYNQKVDKFNDEYEDCLQSIIDRGIDTRSNVDLSNLSETGEKHFINKSQITNCILEIPQNINLELNNGVLTLKAGSIVYVPNGTNIFNKLTISQDISLESITGDAKFLVYVTSSGTGFQCRTIVQSSSGESDPATLGTAYYNILTNIIISHTTNGDVQVSLPIAIVNVSNNTFSSIDKIFNGFGYIGSTIFSLPKVKGLIPNGRNADGTLNNTEFTTSTVRLYTQSSTFSSYENQLLFWGASGVKSIAPYYLEGLEVDKPTSFSLIPAGRVIYFSKDTNKLYTTLSNNVNWLSVDGTYIGKTTWDQDSTQISFTQNGTVEVINRSDFAQTLANNICTTAPTTKNTASSQNPAVIIENYVNGTSGYRVYSDGYCEQWGYMSPIAQDMGHVISLIKSYKNNNYNVYACSVFEGNYTATAWIYSKTLNSFKLAGQRWRDTGYTEAVTGVMWKTEGYIK